MDLLFSEPFFSYPSFYINPLPLYYIINILSVPLKKLERASSLSSSMYSDFLKVSKQTGVPMKKILDLFFMLRSGEPVENNVLLQRVGVSRNVLGQIKGALSSFLQPVSKNTVLKPEAVKDVQGLYEQSYRVEESLWLPIEDDRFQETVELIVNCQKFRPVPKREFDQFLATPETTARRASLLNFFGDIRGKRLLFLGDDDLTSLAIASFRTAGEIVVLDIDERILETIKTVSNEQDFKVKTLIYDARNKFPTSLQGKSDVVFTDPPYTPAGMELFISRSIEALDLKNQAVRLYACYGSSDRAKERFLPIYEMFIDSGLIIRWIFDKFNRYEGAGSIGSASSLFVTEITPKTKPFIQGDYDKSIYTLS